MGLGGAKQLLGLTALCFSNVRHHIPTLRIRGVAGFHIHAELGIQLTELRGRSPSKWQNGQCYLNWSNTRPPCIIFWKKFSWLTCWRYRETNTEVCPQICSATIAAKMPKPRLHRVEIFIVLINSSVGPITFKLSTINIYEIITRHKSVWPIQLLLPILLFAWRATTQRYGNAIWA